MCSGEGEMRKINAVDKMFDRAKGALMMSVCVCTLVLAFPMAVHADGEGLQQGAVKAGRAVGSTAHRIGQAGKDAGISIAKGAVEVGHAAKAGAIEFWHALRGRNGGRRE